MHDEDACCGLAFLSFCIYLINIGQCFKGLINLRDIMNLVIKRMGLVENSIILCSVSL